MTEDVDVYVFDVEDEERQQDDLGEAALLTIEVLVNLMDGRSVLDLTDRERAGVMILCTIVMRLCVQAGTLIAFASFTECAKIFARAGATSKFEVYDKSVMELLDQLDTMEGK